MTMPAGFTQIDNAAIERVVRLSGVAVKVYLSLVRRADNETRSCWPSLGTIVNDTGAGRGNVVRALAELQAAGLVTVESRGGKTARGGPSNQYRIRTSSEIELVPFCIGTGSVLERELVPKRNPNYTHITKPKNKTHSSRPKRSFDEADRATAAWMFSLIQAMNPGHRQPDLDAWANDIRLMREQDHRTDADIRAVFAWANADGFWRTNILSPAKLRKQYDQLSLKRKAESNGNRNNDGDSPARIRSGAVLPDRHAKV